MASSARLDELKKKFDDNPRRYFAPLANEYRKLGDLIQAIALCRTHLPNQPGHISGNIVLAQALYESRELADSREAFEAALDQDPENLIALRYLGDIAREEGAPAVAHAWYQRVLDADPRNDEIAQLLREVQAAESSARTELASRPTPPAHPAIPEAFAPAPAVDATEEDVPVAEMNAPVAADVSEPVEEEPVAFELPSYSAQFAAPTPQAEFEGLDAEDPFFEPAEAMGEFEAVAEPSIDDWFSAAPLAEAESAADAESLFPDLGAVSDLPAPAAEAAAPTAFSWSPVTAEEASPIVAADAPDTYSADPEGDTIEFTIEAAVPKVESIAEEGVALTADAPEEVFEAAPWVFEPLAQPVAETPVEEVEAPSYDWSAADEPSEPMTSWSEEPAPEPASPWEAALAPEQLTPVSEHREQREPNPLLGRTPRFEHAIPEEPPATFVTETMAELYLQQGFNEEGLAIYRQLLKQSPNDESLQRRVASLENGGESSVLDAAHSEAPSVRAFFARFATRARRGHGDGRRPAPNDAADETGHASFSGVASRDEAMTHPDARSSLTQVFASSAVSNADAQAAATLASAFGIQGAAEARAPEGELSLGHLFRDVEAHSPGAVTPAGFADPTLADPDARQAGDVESHADIEQFTAWLEGLKKK